MAILRKSTKLEGQDPGVFVLKEKIPTSTVGCFGITYEGTPAHDPEQKEVEPIPDTPPEKVDHRPKDWYDKQCSYENYTGGLMLNSAPLNKRQADSGEKK